MSDPRANLPECDESILPQPREHDAYPRCSNPLSIMMMKVYETLSLGDSRLTLTRMDAALALALGVHMTWANDQNWDDVVVLIQYQKPDVFTGHDADTLTAMMAMALEAGDG